MPSEFMEPSMVKCMELFYASGLSLAELGRRMGYPDRTARKSAWQFIARTNDPRLSMLRKFAAALPCSMDEILAEDQS